MGELDVIRYGRVYIRPLAVESKYMNGFQAPQVAKITLKNILHPTVNPGEFLPKLLDKEGFII